MCKVVVDIILVTRISIVRKYILLCTFTYVYIENGNYTMVCIYAYVFLIIIYRFVLLLVVHILNIRIIVT